MSKTGKGPSGAAPAAHEPVDDDELNDLFAAAFGACGCVVLGVSGGADSMALMHLAARWTARPRLVVATVDHGLRAEAAAEARWVGEKAAALGLEHHILHWAGPKPESGLQNEARRVRYELLGALAMQLEPQPSVVAVAHHLDDQAETLLMRLARGSGVDGLAAMRLRRPLAAGHAVMLARPLLGLSKGRLIATLRAAAVDWIDDPSNEMAAFERVRLRMAREALEAVGLGNAAIAVSARRLRRAVEALQTAAASLEAALVSHHDGAYASVGIAAFQALGEELRVRLLQRLLARCGAAAATPSAAAEMAQLETLVMRMAAAGPGFAATLAGCQVRSIGGQFQFLREPGRQGLPVISVAPGTTALWDGRFEVEVAADWRGPVEVRALPAAVWRLLRETGRVAAAAAELPRAAVLALPSLWSGQRLEAVPHLGYEARRRYRDGGATGDGVLRFRVRMRQ